MSILRGPPDRPRSSDDLLHDIAADLRQVTAIMDDLARWQTALVSELPGR